MNKNLGLLLILAPWCWSLSLTASQPQTLTLADALERGLARTALQDIFEGRSALAEGAVLQQSTLENPELMISSEESSQDGLDARENYLLLSQRLELFGIKRLRTQAAQHQQRSAQWGNEAQKLEVSTYIKTLFYEVLSLQERLAILEASALESQRIEAIVAEREKAGEVSGYDRRRLQHELAGARAEIALDRGKFEAHWERLRTIVGLEGAYTLSGTLLPGVSAEGLDLSDRPKFQAYDEELKAAALLEKVASHWKLPQVTLEAGIRDSELGPQSDTGFYVSARLPLPVFNRQKAELQQARARARMMAGERALALSEDDAQIRALQKQIQQQRVTIEQFRKDSLVVSSELLAIAQVAYREGEVEILALLDAFQSTRDAQLEVVSMEAETRRLMIELERLGGQQ